MDRKKAPEKSAVVTGGTRGIGYAVAEALLREGFHVFICGVKQAGLESALNRMRKSHGNRISGAVCDVRDYQQVKEMISEAAGKCGGLDVLVNNAGIGRFSSVENMLPEDWRATLETNLSGVFYCCREAIPHMKTRGGGYIINIGSLAGKNFFPGGSAYGASKAGLIAFTEALMQEVRYDHIRVSYIMPGSVETEFGGGTAADETKTWKIAPSDIAEVILGLLRMNPRTLSSRIEIRPSEPKK